jgi:hypothetical protein
VKTFFIVEASHLFRAGDKFETQFFVMDVVNFLHHQYFGDEETETIVLHGSVKEEQAAKYTAALERHGVKVIRMKPIASQVGAEKWYFKPTFYLHKLLGREIPKGSTLVLIGFHNPRYRAFIEQYRKDYHISLAAFATPSKKQGMMTIPPEFRSLVEHAIELDNYVVEIKQEFKHAKRSLRPNGGLPGGS